MTQWHHLGETYAQTTCPHCSRSVEVDHKQTAFAWLYAHILEEHPEELPPIEGTE